MSFTVAIVGRPNVGKSTLFNRLAGKKLAIVDDTPGVTRDWKSAPAGIGGLSFTVVDTAGLEEAAEGTLESRMREQTDRALAGADVVLLMVDARAGVTPLDRHFADWLRRGRLPVILIANKAEGRAGEAGLYEAYELGLGEPVAISAEHGEGMADLFERLVPFERVAGDSVDNHRNGITASGGDSAQAASQVGLSAEEAATLDAMERHGLDTIEAENGDDEDGSDADDPSVPIQLAIVGRPNVGKSTLVNALVGEDRMLTGPEPGVTRDAVSVDWTSGGRRFRLVDTAGLRRRTKVTDKLEKMSIEGTERAIRLAQVVILVISGDGTLDRQDLVIARQAVEEGRALVLALSKWDLVEDREEVLRETRYRLEHSLGQVRGLRVVTVSGLTRRGLKRLMETVEEVYQTWNRRIATSRLNRWLDAMLENHPPPMIKGRANKIRYITQIKARPPTFILWVTRPDGLPDSYMRYLANGLRETFKLDGVPLRIIPRKTRNPYAQ